MSVPPSRRLALAAALAVVACADDAVGPQPRLALAPASRSVSIREDSSLVSADSALVAISGSDAGTARWVAIHSDSASWLTLATAAGTGTGRLRWTRDATGLFPGVYVDTITVTLRTADSASVRLVDTLEVREEPAQYITRRRAWRPGEKDSTIAAIVLHRSWVFPWVGNISDLAPLTIAHWDSVTEVIVNPAWHPPAAPSSRERFLYDATYSVMGMDLWIVFDSLPDTPGEQRDSLTWKMTLWHKTLADSVWNGFLVADTTGTIFGYRDVNTPSFEAAGGHTGVAAGEVRLAVGDSMAYWQGNGGRNQQYRITMNGSYGPLDTLTSGEYTGATLDSGLTNARARGVILTLLRGVGVGSLTVDASWTSVPTARIRCYYTGVTPPTGVPQCTGPAFARIVADLRARRAAASGRVPGTSARGRTR